MQKVNLQELWTAVVDARKKVLLVTLGVMIVLGPVVYFLVPARYQARTVIEIPYADFNIHRLVIYIKGSLVEQVYRDAGMEQSGMSLWRTEYSLVPEAEDIGWKDEPRWLLRMNFVGNDAETAARFLNELSKETLIYAAAMRIDYLQEQIAENREEIAGINALIQDEDLASYYADLFQYWGEYMELRAGPYMYVFVEFDGFDPFLKELYADMYSLRREITQWEKEIEKLRRFGEADLEKYIAFAYPPDYPVPPRPLLAVVSTFLLGLIGAVIWVAYRRFDVFKVKEEGQDFKS